MVQLLCLYELGQRSSMISLYIGSDNVQVFASLKCGKMSVTLASLTQGLADIPRHIIGSHLTRDMRVEMRVDDVAGSGPGRY